MDLFRKSKIQELESKIITDFILGKFEIIIDREIEGLNKLKNDEYFSFKNYSKIATYTFFSDLNISKYILSPNGNTREERLLYLDVLWNQHKDFIKKVLAHHTKIVTLGTAWAIERKAKIISEKICGIQDLYILFDNCEIEELKIDIKKLELHYIDFSISRAGRDNHYITERTIKNLNKIKNLINKAIIFIGLNIFDETLINQDVIQEKHTESAYSPSTPPIEFDSINLQQKLYCRVLELMIIYKSSDILNNKKINILFQP